MTLNFGSFIRDKRLNKNISLRDVAKQIGVSAAYLSDVENNKSAPLTYGRMISLAGALNLTKEEEYGMYDIACSQTGTIAVDIAQYIENKEYIILALRASRDLEAGESEWIEFINKLKSKNIIQED